MILAPAFAADAPSLAKLHAAAFAAPWSAAALETLLQSPGAFAFVARRSAKTAGFILCRAAGEEAEILTLATAPAHRRRGVARALLEAALGAARIAGAQTVFLEVAADNAAARALYGARGFAPVGERPGYYVREDGPVSALVLRLDLNR